MKGALIALTTLDGGRTAAARLVDGQLDDILFDPPDEVPRPGAIYRAIFERPMKGLGGAIVDLGDGKRGFLRDTRGLAPGQPVIVQVTGWAEEHKAAPVARRILLKGRLAILSPGAPGRNVARSTPMKERARLEAVAAAAMAGAPDDLGLVLRTAAAHETEDAIAAEVNHLRAQLARLDPAGRAACLSPAPAAVDEARRDWPDPGPDSIVSGPSAFGDLGVWEAIDALRRQEVPLPGGASFFVEETRAMVAVDVNTGGDLSPAAALKANLGTARELPRQLRLRGMGGVIAVDFAPISRHERQRVTDALKAALSRDSIATTIAGWTPLGLLELSRKRARRPIRDLLSP
jgi:ribonuclease G